MVHSGYGFEPTLETNHNVDDTELSLGSAALLACYMTETPNLSQMDVKMLQR